MTNFLPDGYENLKTEKSYWKMSEIKVGDNRIRIVAKPIAGWIDWKDKKPMRFRPEDKPLAPIDPDKPIKAFWSLYVWDYTRKGLYILEINQSSILKSLTLFAKDEDWGDFTTYDIKITKEGSGKETRYSLTPLPHKVLSPEIQSALDKAPVRLEALYEGKDPWTDLKTVSFNRATGEIVKEDIESPLEQLREHLAIDEIDASYLETYIADVASKKNQTKEQVIESALLPNVLPKFKQHYQKEMAKHRELISA